MYRDVTGDGRDFAEHMADGKRQVATTILQAELLRLARLVPDVDGALEALTELAVAFPVYRSYCRSGASTSTTRWPRRWPAARDRAPRSARCCPD